MTATILCGVVPIIMPMSTGGAAAVNPFPVYGALLILFNLCFMAYFTFLAITYKKHKSDIERWLEWESRKRQISTAEKVFRHTFTDVLMGGLRESTSIFLMGNGLILFIVAGIALAVYLSKIFGL